MAIEALTHAFLVGRDAYLVDTLAYRGELDQTTSSLRFQIAPAGSQIWADWLTVDAAGNVSIPSLTSTGLSVPWSHVTGTPTTLSGYGILAPFWDDATQRMGLGTTTPVSVLSIVNTSAVNPLETHSANAQGIELYTHSNTNFRAPTLGLFRSEGTQAAPTAVANGDWLGYLNIGGYNSGDAAYAVGFQIFTKAIGDWTVAGTRTSQTGIQAGGADAITIGSTAGDAHVGFGGGASTIYQVSVNGSLFASGSLLAVASGSLTSDLTTAVGTPSVLGESNAASAAKVASVIYGTSASAAWFAGLKTRSTTDNSADTIVQNNDGIVRFEGWGADGAAYRSAGYIELQVDGTPGASDMPGRWVFYTTPDGSATPAEVLRLTSAKVATFGGPIGTKGYTVATLPASPVTGWIAHCTDLLAPAFLAVAVGGGTVKGPVFYDGTNWVAF